MGNSAAVAGGRLSSGESNSSTCVLWSASVAGVSLVVTLGAVLRLGITVLLMNTTRASACTALGEVCFGGGWNKYVKEIRDVLLMKVVFEESKSQSLVR